MRALSASAQLQSGCALGLSCAPPLDSKFFATLCLPLSISVSWRPPETSWRNGHWFDRAKWPLQPSSQTAEPPNSMQAKLSKGGGVAIPWVKLCPNSLFVFFQLIDTATQRMWQACLGTMEYLHFPPKRNRHANLPFSALQPASCPPQPT